MSNFLTMIPAKTRLWIYILFAAIGTMFGSMDVGFDAANVADPTWFTVAVKVYGYLGIALGLTAASNVTSKSTPPPAPENNPLRGDEGEYQGKHER